MPESSHALEVFSRIVAEWDPSGDEVKGSSLTERRVDRVVTALANQDVVLNVAAIDMGLHAPDEISAHQAATAENLRASVASPKFGDEFRGQVHDLARRMEKLSPPLYVQLELLTFALARTLRTITMHYAQTEPSALGTLAWRLDAKDTKRTDYERLWIDLVMPNLQTIFVREPLIAIHGPRFDYSAWENFSNPVLSEAPEHLKEATRLAPGEPFYSDNSRKILADLSFDDSRSDRGLQLADILANAFRRAFNGKLGPRGWRRLGQLMIESHKGGMHTAAHYVALTRRRLSLTRMPYWNVVTGIEEQARSWEMGTPSGAKHRVARWGKERRTIRARDPRHGL